MRYTLVLLCVAGCSGRQEEQPQPPVPLIDTDTTTAAFEIRPAAAQVAPPPTHVRPLYQRTDVRFSAGRLIGDPKVVDAVDAVFVNRLDLLAVLGDGDTVRTWWHGDELVGADAPIAKRRMRIAKFVGSVSGWFDEKGMGMDGEFRARPVLASRITSRYGTRFHPVDKRTTTHKGTDYGAPVGTPIHVTANGYIEVVAQDVSAGRHVRVLHARGAQTLYLHMDSFAEGMSVGSEVKAGDIIGYVGTTGKSTGPHLHYELRYAGVAVDSPAVIPPGLTALGPRELAVHRAFLEGLR